MARVLVVSDTRPFDSIIVEHLLEEGFKVQFVPWPDEVKSLEFTFREASEEGDWALIAYGEAALQSLKNAQHGLPHLRAVVAYYSPELLIHPSFLEAGSRLISHACAPTSPSGPLTNRVYSYDAKRGFAERTSNAFDKVSANLAWTRTLTALRGALGIEVDLERVWEEHLQLEFATKDAEATLKTMVAEPYVNHVPTVTGGIGHDDLLRFYKHHFIPSNPPSMTMRLLSRTVGTDRVVDEMLIAFDHTQEICWMVPGVPPTNKHVQVALVSVVCIRGGKLYHEHIYWDQASVLVQLGLLDPQLGAVGLGTNGIDRLPVVGAASAQKVLNESSVPSNDLMSEWT